MAIDFTKIKFAGQDAILVTVRDRWERPILILCKEDIEQLKIVWNGDK